MFMIAAVALIIVTIVLLGWPSSMYLMSQTGQFRFRLTPGRQAMIVASFTAAVDLHGHLVARDEVRREGA